jgi:uncharacterized protein (TIGR02594 family)
MVASFAQDVIFCPLSRVSSFVQTGRMIAVKPSAKIKADVARRKIAKSAAASARVRTRYNRGVLVAAVATCGIVAAWAALPVLLRVDDAPPPRLDSAAIAREIDRAVAEGHVESDDLPLFIETSAADKIEAPAPIKAEARLTDVKAKQAAEVAPEPAKPPELAKPQKAKAARQKGASGLDALASVPGGNDLIAEARKYLGRNPIGWRSDWCGAFLDMVLRRTGRRGGGNLARGYIHYGERIAGPAVGAIVVLSRPGGGHVGIVTGIDSNGNPIVLSGNHNHRVAIATYPARRVLAYVRPAD